MPKKKERSNEKDFHLSEPYQELASETVYSSDKRVGKIFGTKTKDEKFIRLLSRSYKFDRKSKQMQWKKNYGFNLYSILHVDQAIYFLKKIAANLGWKLQAIDEVNDLKAVIQQKEQQLVDATLTNQRLQSERDEALTRLENKVAEISKTHLPSFKADVATLEEKINVFASKKVPEPELQEFLYARSWFFGLDYVTSEPQKLRGAHSKFDFYLERYNKTNDIVEIKLLSDSIINQDGTISAKVIQAVDQLIGYLESAIAAAHSAVISEEEGIKDWRPRGIVIIGSDASKEAVEKLQAWNYQFAHIKIITYHDLLEQGKTIIERIENTQ